MATIRFTEADRDDQGFVSAPAPSRNPEPRSLADLLPTPATATDQAIRRRPATRAEQVAMIGLGLLLAALLGYLYISGDARLVAPPRIPATVPAATQTNGDGFVAPSPIPAMIPAYAAPNEAPRWEIEATRAITPTAHYGDTWIQAEVAGSGVIWLKASDWPALALIGPDLAPRPTARPYVPPTPEPQPPCLTAGTGAQLVTVCDWLTPEQLNAAAAAKWIATYGGNAGIVTTPTPYGGTR